MNFSGGERFSMPSFEGFRQYRLSQVSSSKFFWSLVLLKLSATVFAFFIYSRFTPFIDAGHYLDMDVDMTSSPFRTRAAGYFFSFLKHILHSDFAVHLCISLFLAYVLWYVFEGCYQFLNKWFFYSSLLLPHFMIWTSMVGKEVISIAGFLLIVRASVDWIFKHTISLSSIILGVLLAILRPMHLLIYGYLLFITIFFAHSRYKKFLSPKRESYLLLFVLMWVIFCTLFFWTHIAPYLSHMMVSIKTMFLEMQEHSRANRLNIIWQEPQDYIYNLWWGLPMAIVGPTLKEVFARPYIFPAFLEGCFSLGLFVVIFYKFIKFALHNPKYSSVIIWGFIPAVVFGLFMNYPLGLFNPGSAIRYKQSLAPLLYFYPILFWGELKKQNQS